MPEHAFERIDLLGLLPDEIDALFAERGLERYRSVQVVEWLYVHGAHSFEEMTNLSKRLREELARDFFIMNLVTLKVQQSSDGTKKYLCGLQDGMRVEAVLLPESGRSTVCISTQVGCAFGCLFCASGAGGLARDLTTGEIVEQARRAKFDPDAGHLTNTVLMGMGEPLANYDAMAKAVRIFLHERGFALGKRRVTISTAGYVPGIMKLVHDDLHVRVALSLHAVDNETRDRLMPINKKYPIEQVLDACERLVRSRRTPLTIEYMLLEGVNDSLEDARRLARICRSLEAKANLIPYNRTSPGDFRAPSKERTLRFQEELRNRGILAFIRRSRGIDIDAACGQLRAADPEHAARVRTRKAAF
ncbi:MAG: 23S rRNA (adenine(2503)-C(2))-methyltransferase RlmN [Candidatus Abyssubacteria bacterium]